MQQLQQQVASELFTRLMRETPGLGNDHRLPAILLDNKAENQLIEQQIRELELQNRIEYEEKRAKIKREAEKRAYKTLPRYMQATQAVMAKDSNYHLSTKNQSSSHDKKAGVKRASQNSRKSLRAKRNELIRLRKEHEESLKAKREKERVFKIDNEYIYKKICLERKDSDIKRIQITKGKIKAYLSKKYKGRVADCVTAALDFTGPISYQQYCQVWEDLLNHYPDRALKMAFSVFDFNRDRKICELDLYSLMKTFEQDEQVFTQSFSFDYCKLSKLIKQKRNEEGNLDQDQQRKIKQIDRKLDLIAGKMVQETSESESDGLTLAEWDEDSEENDANSALNKSQSRHTQSKRSLMRKKSMMSSHSRHSRRSKNSAGSKKSPRSRKRRQSVTSSQFSRASDESKEKENPFDHIVGKEMYQSMIQKKHYIEKISLTEFKKIEWKNKFPTFVCEVVKYMTGLDIPDYLYNFEHEKKQEKFENTVKVIEFKQKRAVEKLERKQQQEQYLMKVNTRARQKKQTEKPNELMLYQMKKKAMQEAITKEEQKVNEVHQQFQRDSLELMELRQSVGDKIYNKLERSFKHLCQNPEISEDYLLYLTFQSLMQKHKKIFGYRNDFVAERFYLYLTNNIRLKRVNLHTYISKCSMLFNETWKEKMRFAFLFIDKDRDQIVNGQDLQFLMNNVDLSSPFGQEIKKLINFYADNQLKSKKKPSQTVLIDLEKYIYLLNHRISSIVNEIKVRIGKKPGKQLPPSCLQPSTQLELQGKLGKRLGRAVNNTIDLGAHKDRKHVKFALLPETSSDVQQQNENRKKSLNQKRGSFFVKMEGKEEKELSMRDLLKMRNSLLEEEGQDGENAFDESKVKKFLSRKSISVKGQVKMVDQIQHLMSLKEEDEMEESDEDSSNSSDLENSSDN